VSRLQEFVRLDVHNLAYQDDFCDFAQAIREELLGFPNWIEMRQEGYSGEQKVSPQRQNGITTGHLSSRQRKILPYCLKFTDFLRSRLRELCAFEGVECPEDAASLDIEINAMAYGQGAWLSPHTDSGITQRVNDRLIAWMLYLTHPDEGEWNAGQGGAVRVWLPDGPEARLSPKFNRFAMFKVHEQSFHEIERILRPTTWQTCRLALSGWIRGVPEKRERGMAIYMRSKNFQELRAHVEDRLQGAFALYELMLQQQRHAGVETGTTEVTLDEHRKDYRAHLDSPPGLSFVERAAGPRGTITVLDEERKVRYLGSLKAYKENVTQPEGEAGPGA
jgi:2-oxoglutarate-Fe(II)-dependent oxygenase superfamily protein